MLVNFAKRLFANYKFCQSLDKFVVSVYTMKLQQTLHNFCLVKFVKFVWREKRATFSWKQYGERRETAFGCFSSNY